MRRPGTACRAAAAGVAVLALLGGCAPYPLRGADPTIANRTSEVPTTKALVLPPPGGPAVLAVLETQFRNAVEQEIVLGTRSATAGQNSLHVIMFGPAAGNVGADRFRDDTRLSEESLEKEMEERLPDVAMQTSTFFVQNRYGPFGYAIGRAGANDLCIYAWQRIEAQVPRSPIIKGRGVLDVRLRLCQTGATEPKLLRTMYGYTINAYFLPPAWDPYGRPLPVPSETGRIGGPLAFPEGQQGEGTVLDGAMGPEPRAPSRPRRAPAAASAPTTAQPPSTPLEGYPTVPVPGAN